MTSPPSSEARLPRVVCRADEDPKSETVHTFVNSVPGQFPPDVLLWGNRAFLYYEEEPVGTYHYIECTIGIAPLSD